VFMKSRENFVRKLELTASAIVYQVNSSTADKAPLESQLLCRKLITDDHVGLVNGFVMERLWQWVGLGTEEFEFAHAVTILHRIALAFFVCPIPLTHNTSSLDQADL